MKRIRQWFLKKGIRTKINVIAFLVIVLSTTLIMVGTGIAFSKTMITNGIKQLKKDSSLVISNILNVLDNTESYANDLTVQLNNYFIKDHSPFKDSYLTYSKEEERKRIIQNILYVHPKVYGAVFVTSNGGITKSDNLLSLSNYRDITQTYRELDDSGNENECWQDMQQFSFIGESKAVCAYSKRVIHINTGKTIGYLSLLVEESVISHCFSDQEDSRISRYFISNKDGMIVSSEDTGELLLPIKSVKLKDWVTHATKDHEILTLDGKRMLITKTSFPMLDWQLIGIIPLHDLLKDCRNMLLIVALIGCLTLVAGITVFTRLSLTITRPLQMLIEDVENLNLENLSTINEYHTEDDIGTLTKSYNNMKQRVHDLVINDQLVQEEKRKLELNVLQDQIKPHFFYNTLQLVYVMVDVGEREKARQCIKCLADFYRVTLNNGRDIITMGEELVSTSDYLYLQKIRHTDMFDYTIECPEELKEYRILKLVLQPIVENAISHGFTAKTTNGHITIQVQRQKDMVVIEVTDNGKGMKPEQVAALLTPTKDSKMKSFGLRNVDERIKLYFGHSYGLKISSVESSGTSVSIYLPAFLSEHRE